MRKSCAFLAVIAAVLCLHGSVRRVVAQPPPEVWQTYHDYAAATDAIWELATVRPDLVYVESIGQSVKGRELWMLIVTSPDSSLDKPRVLFDGGMHGSEVIGAEAALRYAQWLVTRYGTDATATELVDNYVTYIVPMVNPDGVEGGKGSLDYRTARKNGSAVNLNRNFDWNWATGGSGSRSSADYRGPFPFSEKESVEVGGVIASEGIVLYLNLHSGTARTQLITPSNSPDEPIYASVGRDITALTGYPRTRGTMGGEALHWSYWIGMDPLRASGHLPLSFLLESYTVANISETSPDWWFRYNPRADEIQPILDKVRAVLIYMTRLSANL